MTKEIKKPWLAAILNLLLPGLGYVYAGKRIGFGIALVLWGVMLLAIMSSGQIPPIMWLDSLVLAILFAYDGYKTAQEVNMNK